jgi:molybdopterin-guanine dinucleotide biosynthesis protein A
MNSDPELYGLILAGGKSSRMGFDKRLIEIDNVSQQEYLIKLLKNYCGEVYLSCKSSEQIPAHLNPLVDQYDLDSPLNGILSAFMQQPDKAWLIVAVDMPLINDLSISTLIANRDKEYIATCYFDSDDKLPEPLFSIWEPSAFVLLNEYYRNGNKSPRLFLQQNNVNLITAEDKKVLTNINTKEDLEKIIKRND